MIPFLSVISVAYLYNWCANLPDKPWCNEVQFQCENMSIDPSCWAVASAIGEHGTEEQDDGK